MTTNQPLKHQATIDAVRDAMFKGIPAERRDAAFAALLANDGRTAREFDEAIEDDANNGIPPYMFLAYLIAALPNDTMSIPAIAAAIRETQGTQHEA